MLPKLRSTLDEYPSQFWTLFVGTLVNSLGGSIIFPFFSLYFTNKLGYTMTEMGVVFSLYAASSMVSQLIGGELVDRVGRKPIMVASLFLGGISSLGLGLIGTLSAASLHIYLAALTVFAGITGSIFGPAVNAMVADLVGLEKRTQAFGLLRVVQNLGVAIGPAIGGFLASQSYLLLFVISALSSCVYGFIVLLFTRETKPELAPPAHIQTTITTVTAPGIRSVVSDRPFILFCAAYVIALLVWSQATTTLPVYLNKTFGVSEQWYGLLMSLNALMVVVLQFPITRFTHRFLRTNMMALGAGFFALGFGLYAFVSALPFFFIAQAIWTIGEMIATPVSQAYVADVAPVHMRGRYMGVFGLVFTLAFGLGPLLGGAVMDNFNGRWLWLAAIFLSGISALWFIRLGHHTRIKIVPIVKAADEQV